MPADLTDQMYCSQQILIPTNLPSILKKYAKAAIRTQPKDLLLWSLHYFRAMADGLPPPVKERIEYPPVETESGLTPGYLKVLLNQIGSATTIPRDVICEKWEGICLERKYVELLFKIGNFTEQVEWVKFVALAAGTIEKNLTGTMSLLCELLTTEPEGGSAIIPVDTFLSLYKYLAALDCGCTPVKIVESEEHSSLEVKKSSASTTSEKPEIWDDLLKEVGDQKSVLTVGTDDIREIDSKYGLQVWPDLVPSDLKLEEAPSSVDNSEDAISDLGIQVWNEDELRQKIEEREVIEPKDEEIEVVKEEGQTSPANLEEKVSDDGKESPPIIQESSKEEEASPEIQQNENEGGGEGEDVPEVANGTDDETADHEPGEDVDKSVELETEVKVEESLPPVTTIVEPNPEMLLVPSPVASEGSACTDEKSIGSVTELEKELSTGQILKPTTSLQNVKVDMRETEPKNISPECVPQRNFWAYIPGIGPPVPLQVVEEVEVYLRHCAAKQSGMVMPRNLRHFLCPTLDGLAPEDYYVSEPECDECTEEVTKDRLYKVEMFNGRKVIF